MSQRKEDVCVSARVFVCLSVYLPVGLSLSPSSGSWAKASPLAARPSVGFQISRFISSSLP